MLSKKTKLVVYPAETTNREGTIIGHIYVNDGSEAFEVAAGEPGSHEAEPGGHRAEITPPGQYVLDQAEHHTTRNWPGSVVPWGARIRERNEIIEYELGGTWRAASGPHGAVTSAIVLWNHRSAKHITVGIASRQAREMFYSQDDGKLMSEWLENDFGKWSWNMKRNGVRTPYFIHTTPADELATRSGKPFELKYSHGCLHIRPNNRVKMVEKHYLAAGIEVEVKRYDERKRTY